MIASRMSLLAGFALLLAFVLGLEWLVPLGGSAPSHAPAPFRLAARNVSIAARETGSWAGAILARPVFSTSRRPPKVALGGKSETAPGQARLSGIMITRSGRRAIFAPEGGGRPLVLAERAQVNQGTIRSIFPDRVVMADGTVLHPSYDRNRAPGATTTLPFQPVMPNFGNPNFPGNPGMLGNPGFNGFAPPNFPPGVQPQNGADGQPPPVFRGTLIPPRREQ